MQIDVVVDLQFGDCGKGKVSKWLAEENSYWGVAKYNGGPNAGHGVWLNGEKHTAHMLTSGVYNPNSKVLIGPGCVLDVEKFLKELDDFESFNVRDRVLIHPNTHIITPSHITQDSKDTTIGTTKQGVGPTYADKMLRVGTRALDVPELKDYLLDPLTLQQDSLGNLLMEGSQGWWLDLDNGFYPYVTSSNVHPAHALSTFGLPAQALRKVYGVGKVYETYVGNSTDLVVCSQQDEEVIRQAGAEYGETTGRARKIGYINLPRLIQACNSTGTSVLVLNKMDILEEVGIFKIIHQNDQPPTSYKNSNEFKSAILEQVYSKCKYLSQIIFSGNKETL